MALSKLFCGCFRLKFWQVSVRIFCVRPQVSKTKATTAQIISFFALTTVHRNWHFGQKEKQIALRSIFRLSLWNNGHVSVLVVSSRSRILWKPAPALCKILIHPFKIWFWNQGRTPGDTKVVPSLVVLKCARFSLANSALPLAKQKAFMHTRWTQKIPPAKHCCVGAERICSYGHISCGPFIQHCTPQNKGQYLGNARFVWIIRCQACNPPLMRFISLWIFVSLLFFTQSRASD